MQLQIIMCDKIKYLEMIQAVITRMANNSNSVKHWSLITLGGGWGLMLREAPSLHVFWAMTMLIGLFWWLSSFYLRCERMFRNIYDEVVDTKFEEDGTTTGRKLFSLTPTSADLKKVECIFCIMIRKTQIWFYIFLMVVNVAFAWPAFNIRICTIPEHKNIDTSTQVNKQSQ